MKNIMLSILKSWATKTGNVSSTDEILRWIKDLNNTIKVNIKKDSLENSTFWYYDWDNGSIVNKNNSFFSIQGMQWINNNQILAEHPIIVQDEIGYLGIICKEIDGVTNFLMQAKIEPGNINKIQISPTIQATKSNFMQKHGGKKPAYLDYFLNATNYDIIVDQIQSEQSSRFYKKRNRNIIIKVNNDVELLPNFKWMTLGQIKELMKYENLVNMDTRTVISCIPFSLYTYEKDEIDELDKIFSDSSLLKSMLFGENKISYIYHSINNYKMFDDSIVKLVSLNQLKNWQMVNNEYICNDEYHFKVIFCDIAIEGREVQQWTQPLFEAYGIATFGLITYEDNGTKKFIIKLKSEIGCFDKAELGPTIQNESTEKQIINNCIDELFWNNVNSKTNIVFDNLLSEEGGRFYCEQNRNIIVNVNKESIKDLPKNYLSVDYKTLNYLIQANNVVNIQLRNLISLLEA